MLLVTGGAGFIGSNFVLDWCAAGDEPIGNLVALKSDPRHVFVRGDIGDRAQAGALLTQYAPRAVVNFAAESHVDRSIHAPAEFIATNVTGTFALLEAARGYWSALP